jgi:hypothetical protein
MVSSEELIKIVKELYKNEQPSAREVPKIPHDGVLLNLFRTFESRLIEKCLLPCPQSLGLNPLWFLGETERNVFLWRNKKSIKDAEEYSFWLDVKKLISKRLAQLEASDPENPFLNPLWGSTSHNTDNHNSERRYLTELLKLYIPAEAHLAAISAVQALVSTISDPHGEPRFNPTKVVLIPVSPTQH